MISALFSLGVNIDLKALYAQRFVRTFAPASSKIFIENPVEKLGVEALNKHIPRINANKVDANKAMPPKPSQGEVQKMVNNTNTSTPIYRSGVKG